MVPSRAARLLHRRADALFELGDALLCTPVVPSLPHLSLEPVCRRGWGSVDAALARGCIDTERLRDLLVDSCRAPTRPTRPVFAVDVTTWPHCDAECSPDRGYYYHPPATRPASRSSLAGPTSGSRNWASTGTPGPLRRMPVGYTQQTTPTRPLPARSAPWLAA
jgi:DDE superfamily endonuclease